MKDVAQMPEMRLLAKPLAEVPTVFSITPDNEQALRAFVRKIPELKGEPGESITGDDGKEGRRGRRGERGSPPDHFVKQIGGGYELRFADPRGEPIVIKTGARGEIGPMPGHEVGDRQFRMQLPNGNWGPWIRQVPGPKGDKGEKGDTGATGLAPGHEFNGSRLRFRKPDGTWGEFTDLRGPTGAGGGGGRGRSANPTWDVIELVGTDLIFRRSTEGPLGPSTTVDLASLQTGGLQGLGLWRYRTEIVEPPSSGQIRFDNASIASATTLWIHDVNSGSSDVSAFLGLLESGDLIYIQQDDTAANFVVVEIGTIVDDGVYFEIDIANIVQQGAAFSQNTQVRLVVTAAGGGTLALNGLTDVTITAPAVGDHLVKSAGDWVNRQPNVQREFFEQMGNYSFVRSDFLDPPGGLQVDGLLAVAAGGGFVSTPTVGYDFTDHPGVWGLNTGGTATGRVFMLSQFTQGLHVGVGGLTRFGTWYQVGAVLSDAANRYVLRAGWSSMALPNTILQGITFEYQDDQNGGRWQALCEDGLGETSVDTGVLAVVSTFYLLEIEVNAAGTSVEFFIDGISVATIVTNIPSGTGFGHFVSIHVMKLTGVVNRAPYVDAYYHYQELSR